MKSVIKNYYLNQKVSLNNKSSFISSELNRKVEQTREFIKKYFGWSGEIIFFPNPYYAKKLLLENYPNHTYFSNYLDSYLFESKNHTQITNSFSLIETNKCLLFWEGSLPKNWVKPKGFLCLEQNSNKEEVKQADFFIFTPVQGISILGFKHKLDPFFFGAGAISHIDRNGYSLVEGIRRFDCGTENYALLLFLYEYFNKVI